MAILSIRTDNGINPRKYILKFNLNELNEEERKVYIDYFLETDFKHVEGKGYIQAELNPENITDHLYAEISVPKEWIEESEKWLDEMLTDVPLAITKEEYYFEGDDETLHTEYKVETHLDTFFWTEGILYSLNQERCRELYYSLDEDDQNKRLKHLEEMYKTFEPVFKKYFSPITPKEKGNYLTAKQKVLLYDYLKEVYQLRKLPDMIENLTITLTMGASISMVKDYNKDKYLKDRGNNGCRTPENVEAVFKYVTKGWSFDDKYARQLKPLIERIERDRE